MDILDTRTMNALSASMIVEEFIRNGVDRFCLAPGSRCTPLTLAVARNPRARVFKHFDERGLGFFALGLARGSGDPAVVITTSGTAVANLLPAVVEADLEDLPLIVLSADRPPELRDTGANQTINQVGLFGHRVRWFVDFPCPGTQHGVDYILHTIDHAVARAQSGPVHLNAMYREPLVPDEQGPNLSPWVGSLGHWVESGDPHTRYAGGQRVVDASRVHDLAGLLGGDASGVLVVGELHGAADRTGALTLGEILGWPVAADLGSGLRTGVTSSHIIHQLDPILQQDTAFADPPEAVIHLGGRFLSRRVQAWINHHQPAIYALCDDSDHQRVPGKVTHRFSGSVQAFCEDLARASKPGANRAWLERWQHRQALCDEALNEQFQSVFSEPVLARTVSRLIPEGHDLFLGNSMPVRDMDMFNSPECRAASIHANRGASGIDGLIASAAGIAAGRGAPLTLLIGDLSALHDLNSLNLLRKASSPMTLVVVNNDGGGIFSFLPVAEQEEVFEDYFGTPHGLQFEQAAAQFELPYTRVACLDDFVASYTEAVTGPVSSLIEVTTQRNLNVSEHQSIRDAVIERLNA